MDIIKDNDIEYFTSLGDIWDYGLESRKSGISYDFNIISNFDYYRVKRNEYIYNSDLGLNNKSSVKTEETFGSLGFFAACTSYKPIKLKWQRYFNCGISYRYITKVKVNGEEVDNGSVWTSSTLGYSYGYRKIERNSLDAIVQYGYNWFLNTRTSANFRTFGHFFKAFYINSEYENDQALSTGLIGSFNYYISPRLRLNLSCELNYRLFEGVTINDDKQFNFTHQLTLTYSLF